VRRLSRTSTRWTRPWATWSITFWPTAAGSSSARPALIRGYTEDSLIEGATVAGAPVMLKEIAAGAASLSF
jgi:hypothetical protein